MAKKVIASVFFFILSLLFSPSAFAFSGYGDGTSNYPYQITTCAQLQQMANGLSAYYDQDNDINCTGVAFTPIGTLAQRFSGVFNGNNYAISNLTISDTSGYTGLFGVTSNATINDVRLTSGSISSPSNPGSVRMGSFVGIAYNGLTISHSSSALSLSTTGTAYIGGLVGDVENGVTIDKSFFNGTIGSNSSIASMGGLAGSLSGSSLIISNSFANGTFDGGNGGYSGGLIGLGYDNLTISNSYAAGTLTYGGASYPSGFVGGFFGGTVTNSFSAITKSTSATYGAMFGVGDGTSTGNYYDRFLSGTGTCTISGSASCTGVNVANADPSYFKANNTNAPLTSWNFTTIWQTNIGAYPTLRGFTSPSFNINPIRITAPSLAPPGLPTSICTAATPIGTPNLFQLDSAGSYVNLYFTKTSSNTSGYTVSYGLTKDANQYTDSFEVSSSPWVIGRTISALSPNTTYYFKVQAKNGCNAGPWSSITSAKTKGLLATVSQWFANLTPTKILISSNNTPVLGVATSTVGCTYTVQGGDSLWTIAQAKWGSGAKYGDILLLNSGLAQNSVLNIGQTLKLCN